MGQQFQLHFRLQTPVSSSRHPASFHLKNFAIWTWHLAHGSRGLLCKTIAVQRRENERERKRAWVVVAARKRREVHFWHSSTTRECHHTSTRAHSHTHTHVQAGRTKGNSCKGAKGWAKPPPAGKKRGVDDWWQGGASPHQTGGHCSTCRPCGWVACSSLYLLPGFCAIKNLVRTFPFLITLYLTYILHRTKSKKLKIKNKKWWSPLHVYLISISIVFFI